MRTNELEHLSYTRISGVITAYFRYNILQENSEQGHTHMKSAKSLLPKFRSLVCKLLLLFPIRFSIRSPFFLLIAFTDFTPSSLLFLLTNQSLSMKQSPL